MDLNTIFIDETFHSPNTVLNIRETTMKFAIDHILVEHTRGLQSACGWNGALRSPICSSSTEQGLEPSLRWR